MGEAIIAVVARHGARLPLPDGIAPVPGPMLVIASRFDEPPFGDLLELAVVELARCGSHVGWCRTFSVVDRPADPRPRSATLEWGSDGRRRWLRWRELGVEVSGVIRRPHLLSVPWVVPQRVLKRRGLEPVLVPTRLRGMLHTGRVAMSVPTPTAGHSGAEDVFRRLAGFHLGAVVTGLRTLAEPARTVRPVMLTGTAQRGPIMSPQATSPLRESVR